MKKHFVILGIIIGFTFLFTLSSCANSNSGIKSGAEITEFNDKCRVIFDSKGGNSINSQVIKNGEKAVRPETPERKGYTFEGWFYDGEEWDFDSMVVTRNITLEAKWKILQFNVMLNTDNENAGEIVGGGTFDYGTFVTVKAIAKKWYDFLGWYIDEDCVSAADIYKFQLDDEDVNITAKWKLKEEVKNFSFVESSDGESIIIHETINKDITSIYIPEYVSEIASGAFRDCTSLESIELPFIGKNRTEGQFLGYIFGAPNYSNNDLYIPESLKKVVLHTGVESIPNNAFSGCKHLEEIEIPNSIKTIGQGAFDECEALKYINDESELYLGNSSNPYLVFVKSDNTSAKSISINKGTKYIMPDSLKSCSQIESVSSPFFGSTIESSQYLGYLFGAKLYEENSSYIPTSLKKVVINDGDLEIDSNLLYGAQFLKEIIIPKTVTKLSKGMLNGFDSLESITVPFLGEVSTSTQYLGYIFGADSYLYNKDYIPETLKKVIILSKSSVLSENAFYKCDSIEYLEFKEGLKTIEYSALVDCTSLKELIIPKNVEFIEESTFINCSSLESITLPFIGRTYPKASNSWNYENSILGYLFGLRKSNEDVPQSLTKVTVLDGCLSIGYGAFFDCKYITSIELPDSLIYLPCLNLCSLTHLIVPISDNMELEPEDFPDSLSTTYKNGKYKGSTNYPYLFFVGVIDETQESVEFHEDVKYIGSAWDFSCFLPAITSLRIPDGVKRVYHISCDSLKEVILPKNVKINTISFDGCLNLETVTCAFPIDVQLDGNSDYQIIYGEKLINFNLLEGEEVLNKRIQETFCSVRFVTLPKSIIAIDYFAFDTINYAVGPIIKVNYAGTKEEFSKVVFTDNHSVGKTIRKVICTDGEVWL